MIYWFDEENQVLEPVATTVTNNTATAQVTHFSKYILLNEREYLDGFDWVEEYTLYKDYDEIQVVFMIDCSSTMAAIDPSSQRYSHVTSIASSLPANSKTGVIILYDDIADYIDYNGDLYMWSSQNMSFYLDYITHSSGGTSDIFPFFDVAMSGFDSDTANHKILREIVILTDGNGLDSSGYAAALASATANDVVVSVLAYDDMFYPPIVSSTHGTFGTSSALNNFIRNFCNVIDFGNDTYGDGIPNIYENSVNLYNGQTISTEYLIADTDGDGLSDGEEVRLEIMYSPDGNCATVVGHLISDPNEMDSEGDGVPDNEDNAPLTKGLAGGIVGELSLVSYFEEGKNIYSGHSFLLYKSYIYDTLDLSGLYYRLLYLSFLPAYEKLYVCQYIELSQNLFFS